MDQLRKARSIGKGMVTRKANKLNELLTAGENANAIKEMVNDLDGVSKQFQNAHEEYRKLLKDEQALTESTVYCNTVNETCLNQKEIAPPSTHGQHIPKSSADNAFPVNHSVPSKSPENQPKRRPKETPLKQHYFVSAPEWFLNQPPLSHRYNGQAYDYPLQHLMETHEVTQSLHQ